MDSIQAALDAWSAVFNTGDYYAAHDYVERPWYTASEPDKTFLKGLIHVSVALAHYQRGNRHGARVKLASGRRYLEVYLPRYRGVDLEQLLADAEAAMAGGLATPEGTPLPPLAVMPVVHLAGRDATG